MKTFDDIYQSCNKPFDKNRLNSIITKMEEFKTDDNTDAIESYLAKLRVHDVTLLDVLVASYAINDEGIHVPTQTKTLSVEELLDEIRISEATDLEKIFT